MGSGDGQLWLLQCLSGTLDANQEIRIAAENALKQASIEQGYGVELARVIVNKELPVGFRQLAGVLLKQYVKQHWQEGENYTPPTVPFVDKAAIRSLLLSALDDPCGKVRTAVGMAVASIAAWDWPEEWPDLLGYLLESISGQSNLNRMRGALRCLSLFAGDVDDAHMPSLVPVLFPSLYAIVSSEKAFEPAMRRRALMILHSCVATLGVMSGAYQSEMRALMKPMLKAWMEQFAMILSSPVPLENSDDWGMRMEALKCLTQIVQNFPKITFDEFPVVLFPLWQTFVSGLSVYERSLVQGSQEAFSSLADSDGNDQSTEALMIQLLEFLLVLISSPRFSKVLEKHVGELVYYMIGYMQMTEEQVQAWSSDPNQYISDEDDMTYNCRVSGIILLEELVEMYDLGLQYIMDATQRRMTEADEAKLVGKRDWWKLREAAILALGTVSDSFLSAKVKGSTSLNVELFLDKLLVEDLAAGGDCPFLHGRALWAVAKFSPAVKEEKFEQFLLPAIVGLGKDAPSPIKVGACRALTQLFPRVNSAILRPHLGQIYGALGMLLHEASEEILHLVLETLQATIEADETVSASLESTITSAILSIWAHYVSDPFISLDAMDVLETLKNVPGCWKPVSSRVLIFITPILANPHNQPTGSVAGALDMLAMLLKHAPLEVVQPAHDMCFKSVIDITTQSEDHSELQNATECLTAFVNSGRESLLTWSGDPSHTMKMLLEAASRLLDPGIESSASLFVGNFITELVQQFSSHMAPFLRDLVMALVARMQTAQMPGLTMSIILVFARLVHMSAPNIGQLIDLMAMLPADGYKNVLEYVMSEWTKHQGDIQGAYRLKVSTAALSLLLASGHSKLAQISVQGHLIQSSTGGILTRSRAKVSPNQWTRIPLPCKIFSLLADALLEMQEQSGPAAEVDEDWEEDGSDDDPQEENHLEEKLVKSSVFLPLEQFGGFMNESDEENEYQEDPSQATDPLNQINLSTYLVEFFKNLAQQSLTAFEELAKESSDREKMAVKAALGS
ncbi:hypothetical protein O6H91_05G098700 [Diphasiastrum complanatum]|uniref:Uncharacterized protein n=1 Tax=Diphasiastrum complanatum TaxID=34168 RepID=A0ACC2DRF4_DIPCM|nr:hypothetical protein O6H91_05G098700 [Diphasiastrum complanatum]